MSKLEDDEVEKLENILKIGKQSSPVRQRVNSFIVGALFAKENREKVILHAKSAQEDHLTIKWLLKFG